MEGTIFGKKNYGFKTCKSPPQQKDLMEFEDLRKIISNMQFRRVSNDFQNRLKVNPVIEKSICFHEIFTKWKITLQK